MSDELPTVGLDPEWIAQHVVVDGAHPASAEFGGFIGTGQMSRNARFGLEWSGTGVDGPSSVVVVKIPSSEPGTPEQPSKSLLRAKPLGAVCFGVQGERRLREFWWSKGCSTLYSEQFSLSAGVTAKMVSQSRIPK